MEIYKFCVFFVTLFAVSYLEIQLITAEFGSDCRVEYCTINEECHSTNETCICDQDSYRNEMSCELIDDLKPNDVVLKSTGTHSMLVTWTSKENQVVSGFEVILMPYESLAHIIIINKSATITGLVPGRLYSVLVETKIKYLADRKTNGTMSNISRTRPAKTAGLAPGLPLNAPNINITFHKAEGEASGYIVRLQRTDPNMYNQTQELDNSMMIAEFLNVTAGLSYHLSIITVSGEMQSEQYTTVIQVKAQQSDPMADLQAVTVSSREISVTWKKPENPNGKIFQYHLEALNGTTCIQSVIFNCTDCNWENMTMDDSESSVKECNSTIKESVMNNELHEINYTLTGLYPDTTYTIVVSAYNEVGRGASSEIATTTEEEAATKPKDFQSRSKTSNSIYLMWTPPLPRPGVTSYNITVYEQMETTVEYKIYKSFVTTGFYETSNNITGLSSYWNYKFEIFAFTSKGASDKVESGVVITDESAPTAVEYLDFEKKDQVYDQIQLSWSCPPQKDGRNGVIKSATVKYSAENSIGFESPEHGSRTFPVTPDCVWNEKLNVTAEFNYTFEVFITNSFNGEKNIKHKYMPAGVAVIRDRSVQEQQKGVSDHQTSVPLSICPSCILDRRNGRVISSGITVCKNNCPAQRKRRELRESFDKLPNWSTAKSSEFNIKYRATPETWLNDTLGKEVFVYIIGGNSSCDIKDTTSFCNGPLVEATTYEVSVFVCTSQGCATSEPVKIATKEPPPKVALIIGTVCGVLAAIVVVVVVVVVIIRRKNKSIRPQARKKANEKYTSDTSQQDDTYEEITGGHRLSVIQDGGHEVDYYNTLDSPPRSDNTYDQLAVYYNEGNHDYGQIKVTV